MGTSLQLKKNDIKQILHQKILGDDANMLIHLTNKNVVRVHDFYIGFCVSFNNFSEPPYQEDELTQFVKDSLYNFFKEII